MLYNSKIGNNPYAQYKLHMHIITIQQVFVAVTIEGNLEKRPSISIKIPDSIVTLPGILRKCHISNGGKRGKCVKFVTIALFITAKPGRN